MKIDVTQKLFELDGKTQLQIKLRACPMCGRDVELSDPLTLRSVCVEALDTPLQQDRELDKVTKLKMFDLVQLIFHAEQFVDLTAAQIVMLQQRISDYYLACNIVGQAEKLLEHGAEESK